MKTNKQRNKKVETEKLIIDEKARKRYCCKANQLQWIKSSVLAANFTNPTYVWLENAVSVYICGSAIVGQYTCLSILF